MATDTAEGLSDHVRGVTVTTLAAVGGIVAAFISQAVVSGPTDQTALVILLATIALEVAVIRGVGLDDDLDAKSVLFIGFITFAMWFVSLTVLLTAGVAGTGGA